ncbi:MAG TPA: hypothetical protein VIR56_05720, partial [Solimonas sp.]
PTAPVVQPPGTPVPPPPAVPATAPVQIPQTPPQPAPPAVPPTSTHHDAASDSRVDVAGMQATSTVGNAVADVTRGICNIGHGEHWQSASDLTLEQCAAALAGGDQAYDEHGLRHAYWPGVHLSASSTAIYQSSNGSAWTRLRTTLAD